MITDLFSTLLEELGSQLKIKDLKPDDNHSCLIKFPTGLEIQLEPDVSEQFLVVGTKLGAIPQGRYRDNVFKEALKANGMEYPRYGNFAFSKKSEQLIMFQNLPFKELNGVKLFDFLKPFTEKAFHWKESIARGEVPAHLAIYSTTAGMFITPK